jgi:ABC-type oligopeptide transport system substrate-binding subunit
MRLEARLVPRRILALALLVSAGVAAIVSAPAYSQGNPEQLVVPLEGNPPVDPALAVSPPTMTGPGEAKANAYATGCKLANFRDPPGRRGEQLVPEVAKNRIQVRDNGRTYRFDLRRTYRFNTGARVTAANFVAAFNRSAQKRMSSPATTFMEDIVGANAVIQGRASRISGIRALGRYRLQIRLKEPTPPPDLLKRLTLPFFQAIPRNTPVVPGGITVPSCGPYYYRLVDRPPENATPPVSGVIVLQRNPFYPGPRKANIDQIVQPIGIGLDQQMQLCESGNADICGFPPAQAAELRDRYGVNRGRFFVKGQAVFWYLNFNHDEPLFRGNNRLKQAVNHAIDRPQMVRQHGALGGARTDQILPIDFPGFRNWNLYSLRGANTTRARQLADGNTRGGTVRFAFPNNGWGPAVAQVVDFNLRQIGLNVTPVPLDRITQTTRAGNRNTNDYDLLLNGWGEDYPDPYDFINILLQGTSIQPDNNVNLSYFNESRWNRRMEQAAGLFGAQRLRTYAILDRDLMRGPAPVAPYINTNARILVSSRVRNHVFHKVYGTDFAALNLVG